MKYNIYKSNVFFYLEQKKFGRCEIKLFGACTQTYFLTTDYPSPFYSQFLREKKPIGPYPFRAFLTFPFPDVPKTRILNTFFICGPDAIYAKPPKLYHFIFIFRRKKLNSRVCSTV